MMITIYSWFGYDLPIKERYRLIKQAGFDGVMIWWVDDIDKIDFRSQPENARNSGLFVENMHTPFNGNTNLWMDNLDGEEITKRLINCVEECYIHQIPTMVVHLTSGNPPPVNEIALKRFKRIIEKAEQKGINIAMENIKLIDYLRYILDNIHSKRVRFYRTASLVNELIEEKKQGNIVRFMKNLEKCDLLICDEGVCAYR
jgi:L-ribulose-5-phosphate 3-epimerase